MYDVISCFKPDKFPVRIKLYTVDNNGFDQYHGKSLSSKFWNTFYMVGKLGIKIFLMMNPRQLPRSSLENLKDIEVDSETKNDWCS